MAGKPLGVGIGLRDGIPTFYVTPIDRVADRIWDAVREAISANMTPTQFKEEVIAAWRSHLADDAKDAERELRKS